LRVSKNEKLKMEYFMNLIFVQFALHAISVWTMKNGKHLNAWNVKIIEFIGVKWRVI